MSHFTRVLVKPRVIAGFVHTRTAPLWRMNTIQIQQRKMVTIDDSSENQELQGEQQTDQKLVSEATVYLSCIMNVLTNCLLKTSSEARIFRLEDSFIQVTKDIGQINGRIGTIEWQIKVLLGICLTGTGSVTLYLVKSYFDGLRNSNMQKSNEAAGEVRIRALVEEGFKNVLENMKSQDATKKSMNKQ